MKMKLAKEIVLGGLVWALALVGEAATSVTTETPTFELSIKHDGVRMSRGSETLTYSSRWDGGADTTVTLAQDGETLQAGLTGEGTRPWSVTRNGTYTLTHTTYTNGVAGKVETATFVVAGLDVPFASGDVTVANYADVYDGQPHGIGVTVADGIAGVAKKYATDPSVPFTEELPTLTNVGTLTVWCEISAPGYITQTNSAIVTITPRPVTLTSGTKLDFVYDGQPHGFPHIMISGLGFVVGEGVTTSNWATVTAVAEGEVENAFDYAPFDGTDLANYEVTVVTGKIAVVKATPVTPGGPIDPVSPDPTDPSAPYSAYDFVGVYDGAAHTIDTNALRSVVYQPAAPLSFQYALVKDGALANEPFMFTDVVSTSFWYRISAPNFADYWHEAKVTITNRPVTLTSGTKTDFGYDGTAHAYPHIIISGLGFIAGEGVTTSNWATVTAVAEGEVENAFDYAAQERTDLANYDITVITGKIAVIAAPIPVGPGGAIAAVGYTNVYDGAAHGVAVSANGLLTTPTVQYRASESDDWADASPMFSDVCDTQVWYRVTAPNYAPVVGTVGVRIMPRTITLTSKSLTKPYDGTPLTAHEVTVGGDGFADGEGATYAFTGEQTAVGESENAFTYTLNANTSAGNYEITTANGTLAVTKASIGGEDGEEPGDDDVPSGGVSKFDATFVYDGEGHTLNTNALQAAFGAAMIGEISVGYALDDGNSGSGEGHAVMPWMADAPVYTNAGEYAVWYRVVNPNYEEFIHAAKITITNRLVTVSVAGHTATYAYDTTEKRVNGYDAVTEDALYDIAADTVFGGTAEATRTDAGTTAMGLTAGDFANSNANFLVTYEVTDGWLSVTPRVVGDDPSNWDIRLARNPMYDGTERSAPITQVAFVKPDGNLDDIPYTLSGNVATDAGNYVVRITGTGNYVGTIEKEWAITPRNITLTSGRAEWVYDGTAHSESGVAVTGDGFVAGEGADYSGFPVVRHVADAAEPMANAFAYAFNANTKAQNYEVTVRYGTVKMAPRAITLTAPTKEKPYDGTPLTFGAEEVEAVATGVALPGGGHGQPALPDGEAFALGDFASITEAGRVAATFTVADGTALMADYAITIVPGTLTVTRSATQITVTAKSGSWIYDGQPHTLHEYEATNLGVLQPGDALDVTFSDDSVVAMPIDGPEQNGIVENAIAGVRILRGELDVTSNYTLAPYSGTLTVTKRPVVLTSKSASKTYDGEPLAAHEVEIGGDGFVGEDGATFTFTGSRTDKGTSKNTFAYTLKSGTRAENYAITKVDGDLEVTAADISDGDDSDWQIVMGPSLAYTGLEQIQTLSSVTYRGLPLDCSITGNAQTDAGNYAMTLAGQGNFAGTHDVAWTIAPKSLSLTAGSGSRVYDGTPLMVGTVTAIGFVAGEGAEYECAGSQTDVGSSKNNVATINWSANTKGSNYAVTKLPGTLTVTPRPVTLTAANISKPYDGTPLALTAADIAVDGIVAGESFVFGDFASRTEAGQSPATFTYDAGPGTKLGNYAVTVTPGATITITRSATAISVTAASESWAYDGESHSNRTWTATNLDTLQAGDTLEVTFDDASAVTTPQDGPGQDGVVANAIANVRVIRNGIEDVTANYTVEWFPGTLTVTKRPVTVNVKGRTATFTYDGNEQSVEGYDMTTDEELYDISADTAFSGTAEATRTDAGKTEMGLVAVDFTNNNNCFEVTYAVMDGWVKIEPLDIAAAGDDFVLALGANPKYNGTVQSIPVERVVCRGLPVTCTRAGEKATHAGAYTLTVKANGNFTGERSTTWQMLKRHVTLTSGSATKPYDGSPVRCGDVHITGDGFIGLEGATFDVRGSQTVAGSSKNAFAYTLKAGTLSGDYDIVKVEGDLTVTKATYPGQEPGGAGIAWSVAPDAANWVYDGRPHGVALTGVPAGVTARLAGNEAVDAGDYVATVTLDYDAANYEPPVTPAPLAWSIAPRSVTLVSDGAEKVYDGTPLRCDSVRVKDGSLGFVAGEGFSATCSGALTDVGAMENLFDYVLTGETKVGNYEITKVYGTLTVTKAVIGGEDGEEPGADDVPTGGVSKFDATFVYDGEGHTIDTNALQAAFGAALAGAGETRVGFGYTADGAVATGAEQVSDWREVAPVYTNAGAYVIWYKVTNPNYEDFIHQAKVTITPRDIALATIAPIPDVTFADSPATPVPVVTDQTPSIITASDYDVSYRDNDRPGTATVTLTGKGNYRGTKSATFVIKLATVRYAALTGTLAWKLNLGTGCYTAQLKLTCTNGFSQGISDLKFVYQDRRDGTKITAGLWNSSARAYRPTVSIGGTTYRFVDLDATKLTAQDVTALYGVADVSQSVGTVPSAQCVIELFVSDLSSPVSDIGYVMWKSNGAQCSLPISAAGGSQGLAVSETMLGAMRLASSASPLDAPLSTAALNTSLALGVVLDPASSPYCRLTAFAVTATGLSGRVEVGKVRGGCETRGALGANAQVVLMGAKSLSDGFAEIGRVAVDENGAFLFPLGNKAYQFFKVKIVIENVVE